METSITSEDCVRIGNSGCNIELRPAAPSGYGHTAIVSFQAGLLQGVWTTHFASIWDFVHDLAALHSDLTGEAVLSDDDSMAVTFSTSEGGRVVADVNIAQLMWAFGVDGHIRFSAPIDQSYLTEIVREFRRLFPPETFCSEDPALRSEP